MMLKALNALLEDSKLLANSHFLRVAKIFSKLKIEMQRGCLSTDSPHDPILLTPMSLCCWQDAASNSHMLAYSVPSVPVNISWSFSLVLSDVSDI